MDGTRVLRSALSAEDALRTRETIEKGFEVEPAAGVGASVVQQETVQRREGDRGGGGGGGGGDVLFSSGSDASEDGAESREPPQADTIQGPATRDDATSPRKPHAPTRLQASANVVALNTDEPAKQPETRVVFPKVKNPTVATETKRPLPRATRSPGLSCFPVEVAAVCKRVAAHRARSAVLDDADYRTFEAQYDAFVADWETLDKAREGCCGGCRCCILATNTNDRRTRLR